VLQPNETDFSIITLKRSSDSVGSENAVVARRRFVHARRRGRIIASRSGIGNIEASNGARTRVSRRPLAPTEHPAAPAHCVQFPADLAGSSLVSTQLPIYDCCSTLARTPGGLPSKGKTFRRSSKPSN
jgi:hypothetical protein